MLQEGSLGRADSMVPGLQTVQRKEPATASKWAGPSADSSAAGLQAVRMAMAKGSRQVD